MRTKEGEPVKTLYTRAGAAALCAALLLAAVVPSASGSSVDSYCILDAGLSLVSNDNLGNSDEKAARKSDASAALRASAGWRLQFGDLGSADLTAELRGERYSRYSALDNASAGASLAMRHKFGLGPYAAWAGLQASAAVLDSRASSLAGARYYAAARRAY